jgi:outer membrane immunogenic protein
METEVNKIVILAALSATAAATPAFAQSAPVVGPRLEGFAGYDRINYDGTKDGGAMFGLGVGYDMPVTSALSLGVDAEADISAAKKEVLPGEEVKPGRDLYAGGRATMAVSPTANLYVKGGYTNAKFKYDGSLGTDSTNLDGYRLGVGGQMGVGGKAYVGAEYRYSNYEQDVTRNQVVATIGTRF